MRLVEEGEAIADLPRHRRAEAADEVARQADAENTRLPADLDYTTVRGLSKEVQGRLNQHKPETIGQASRIQGITPAAISLLLVWLKRGELARGTEHKPE